MTVTRQVPTPNGANLNRRAEFQIEFPPSGTLRLDNATSSVESLMKARTDGTKILAKKQPFKFSWKTPERRIGGKSLPLIANEIYLAIFKYLEPCDDTDFAQRAEYRTTLSNLALVCRFFCAETLPRIFRSMEYSGLVHGKSTPSYAKFCRELIAGEQKACYLGQYVRECSVAHWMQAVEQGQWVFANFLKVYMKSITSLVNLETLRLWDTPIDVKFLVALGALEKLTSLSISRCNFQSMTKDHQYSTRALKLVHFELFHHCGNGAALASLAQIISSSFLRTLRTDNWGFLKSLMTQTVSFNIETLTIPISVSEADHLRHFLNKTPTITELSINNVQFAGPYNQLPFPMLDLAPSSLPRLNQLACPTCLIADFVPGRPLTSIKINSLILRGIQCQEDAARDQKQILSVLKRSTGVITTLRVPAGFYAAASCDQMLPQLETLIIDFPLDPGLVCDPEVLNAIFTKYPCLPCIRYIHLCCWARTSWSLNLLDQLSLVCRISAKYPKVLTVRITDEVEWRRHRCQDDEWRPFVAKGWKTALKSQLIGCLSGTPHPAVKDYCAFFAGLFDPSSAMDKIYLRHLGVCGSRNLWDAEL